MGGIEIGRCGDAISRRRRWAACAALIAVAGFVTALGAAETAAEPEDPDALARTVTAQKIASGQRVKPVEPALAHQREPLTAAQMRELADEYEGFIRKALDSATSARMAAYRSKDIIRMTCIDDKLLQMKNVFGIVEPRFITVHVVQDPLGLRGQFAMLQQAFDRVKTLVDEMEACLGDSLDAIAGERAGDETPPDSTDPTGPAPPGHEVERPAEASPFR